MALFTQTFTCLAIGIVFGFVIPSEAFTQPNYCGGFGFRKNLHEVDSSDAINMAGCVMGLLQQGDFMHKSFRNVQKTVGNLARSSGGTTFIQPAYIYAGLFQISVMLISYHHATQASQYLQEAEFARDEMHIVLEAKIAPILGYIDEAVQDGDMQKGMKTVCKAKNVLDKKLKEGRNDLIKIRKGIEKRILDSVNREKRNEVMQWLTGSVGSAGAMAIALAPCPFTAFFGCPIMIAGAVTTATGIGGWFSLGENKKSYQEVLVALKKSRNEMLSAEKSLEKARSDITLLCLELEKFEDWPNRLSSLIYNLVEKLFQKFKSVLQISDDNPKSHEIEQDASDEDGEL